MIEVIYYWEHATDESRSLRSSKARDMARLAHNGEVGVIVDDGGPLTIEAVEPGDTIRETTDRLVAAGQRLATGVEA